MPGEFASSNLNIKWCVCVCRRRIQSVRPMANTSTKSSHRHQITYARRMTVNVNEKWNRWMSKRWGTWTKNSMCVPLSIFACLFLRLSRGRCISLSAYMYRIAQTVDINPFRCESIESMLIPILHYFFVSMLRAVSTERQSGRRCAMSFPFRQFSKVSHIRVGTHTHTSNAVTYWMWMGKRLCCVWGGERERQRKIDWIKRRRKKYQMLQSVLSYLWHFIKTFSNAYGSTQRWS